MKIMITGGAGFIGSHLAIGLAKEHAEIIVLDNFHPYYSRQRKQEQLSRALQYKNVDFYECDILDALYLEALIGKEKPDVIVHLAGLPGVQLSLQDPHHYVDINVKGTINILSAAGKHKVKQVVFASSSSVYGEKAGVPLREDMADGRLLSPYAASKYSGEAMCYAYQHMYGFQLNILRFFTVYGPWGRPDMAIGSFLRKLQKGEPLHIFGAGTGRDYTYIDDIVEGICRTLYVNKSGTFNIGSDAPVLMKDVLIELKKYFPEMNVIYEQERMGDVTSTWADLTNARQQLGYEPRISFAEGLRRTVAWAREHAYLL
ncbi:SDR family NAD(P)-dependent oxidoreductase [Ectobacillus antri]|uniref:SDR family NAD(P)-dependent oxidoreductase n=1 Tax=Ectobacillus antri TaxID=2486280 RepID=A0ABT6H3L8_9BACI|nr:SDR family NAD(P)-dependent oxidoreductase [Ectobacillus antri]MDG4656575.1 SDR family NAD(P)-dependent oxidoreductase [Ectobacillus antri]MDG5753625.1 SDR family NAD(P)-dependent oxidoreductase [Ectobacillus antri]